MGGRPILGFPARRRPLLWTAAALLAAGGGSGYAAQTDIDQVGQRFTPSSLKLQRGDKARFLNRDDVTHNISIIDAGDSAADLGLQRPGQVIEAVFDKTGRFVIRCSVHPRMRMVIQVD